MSATEFIHRDKSRMIRIGYEALLNGWFLSNRESHGTRSKLAIPLLAFLGSCAMPSLATASGKPSEIAARTEHTGALKRLSPSLSLDHVETIELSAADHSAIRTFAPRTHGIQLSNNRCLRMIRGPMPKRELLGATIENDVSNCPSVSALPTPRCDDYAQEGQIGTWRLACRRLAGKRTGLIAVGIKENVGLEVLLGVLDQEVAFVNDFTLHDRVEIITLGRRADGKTVLSYFWWQPAATGK
jgi:hypothetical protein